MKAVVFKAPYELSVETVDDPTIQGPLDTIIRITTANIYGSDLHPHEGRIGFNDCEAFIEGISIAGGQCPVKKYNRELRDIIIRGRANPSWIVSHELSLDDAVDAYSNVDKRENGWTTILLHP
ncbi:MULTISPECIES: hypothetical protein [unclassified Arthrobacter]|uniref:hypothetical protein n=1 Tax=Arthrobacter sp. N1 TaxID=619291 RepID=UPI003BB0B27E